MDLLQFINLKKFNSDDIELPSSYEKVNPLDVLLKKRPDIEHIQLTCDNTNVILPYIDLVNEILEYYVVNHSITGFKGFNVGESTSDELLANPQFVNEQAYLTLKDQIYPFDLPFNRNLEAMRLLYDNFNIKLYESMIKLRANENLDLSNAAGGGGGGGNEAYAWREIYNEFLGISPEEYKILTYSVVRKIPAYFGENENMFFDDFNIKLSNAKTFARKTGITYEELLEVVTTRFINPDSYLIPKLNKLFISFMDIKKLKDGTIPEIEFIQKIPPDIDISQYGGNIKQWIKDNYNRIMNIITLIDP